MDHDAARSTAEQALEQLAGEYGLTLLGLAVSLVGDHQAAEEVVQDALYRAYRHLERRRPVTRAWLSQAVIWRARAVRRQAWWRRVAAVAQVPPPPAPDAEGAVVAAMRGLPRSLREVALLHYWAGFHVDEVGHLLHVPAGTIKSRLHRARQLLRRELSEGLLDEGAQERKGGTP